MKQYTTKDFTLSVFYSDDKSFFITSTLVEKGGKAFLINAGFTQAMAQAIVTYLKDKHLDLEKVYLLHGDPDYYFGLEAIKHAFPEVTAYATQETFDHITHTVGKKLAVWSPQLGEQAPTNVVLPKVLDGQSIDFAGLTFDLIGDDNHRTNLYQADNALLLGGIDTFNDGIHVFLADTATPEKMQSWIKRLDSLAGLNIDLLIPSHAHPEGHHNKDSLIATESYLANSLEILETAKDSSTFMDKMSAIYPNYANQGVLGLSAKVVTGEMPWG